MSEHDEYGLKKPHKSWTERGNDWIKPGEDAGAAEQIGRGLAAAPVLLGAHFMDEFSTFPGFFLGEMSHGVEVENYNRERARHEPGPQYVPSEPGPDLRGLDENGECNPDHDGVNADGVPYFLERPAEPTYQWMAD